MSSLFSRVNLSGPSVKGREEEGELVSSEARSSSSFTRSSNSNRSLACINHAFLDYLVLSLSMYHQIKNVIGVNPTFYEYLQFTVDADTVDTLSVNRLISAMIRDKKLIAVCGETQLANAKQSIITMIPSHTTWPKHSWFFHVLSSTYNTHKPVLISTEMINDYLENRVDTFQMKNLLHLGEDRYLTTLLLKHFSIFKTQFVRDAHAFTVAPDDWRVLVSQRRRHSAQSRSTDVLGATLRFLLFLDAIRGYD